MVEHDVRQLKSVIAQVALDRDLAFILFDKDKGDDVLLFLIPEKIR